jgi:hypothetical protein
MATEKAERHKFPGVDQTPAQLVKSGNRKTCSDILKRPNSIWEMEECSEEWKGSIMLPIYTKSDKTDCSNYTDILLLPTTYKFYATSCCQGYLHVQKKLMNFISMEFEATVRLLIVQSAFVKMEIRRSSALAICRIQESLRFS